MTFESFDGVGELRPGPIDANGTFESVDYSAVPALGLTVSQDSRLSGCWARQAYSFALGRYPSTSDQQPLADTKAQLESGSFRASDLVVSTLLSRGFREVAPPTP
jgi:hypothetical protein